MKRRILLVEDDPMTIALMSDQLNLLGYDVTVAKNGLEAVEMASSESPDLIIMDIMMPKLDGFQAVSRIRENPKVKAIPILVATALARPGSRQVCQDAGCDDYIGKPFTYKQLGAAVKKLLDKQLEKSEP
jgi:CheY-like chemotaxis protein